MSVPIVSLPDVSVLRTDLSQALAVADGAADATDATDATGVGVTSGWRVWLGVAAVAEQAAITAARRGIDRIRTDFRVMGLLRWA